MRILSCGALALCLALAACAGDFADGGNGGGDAADAGASGCSISLIPVTGAVVGQEVEVNMEVSSSPGFQEFGWSVRLDGVDIDILSDQGDRITFLPAAPGPYEVSATGSVDGLSCSPDTLVVNVQASGAQQESYWLRISGASWPAQERRVTVFGGADQFLGAVDLDEGVSRALQLRDASGQGVAAYLRASKVGDGSGLSYESFSNGSGEANLRVPDGVYDLLVVPSDAALPSRRFEGLSSSELQGVFTLPASISLSGQILAQDGTPIQDASVSVLVDGARSGRGSSDAQGRFAVQGYAGALTGLSVVPPQGRGLPTLQHSGLSGQSVDSGSDIVIRYSLSPVAASVDADLAGGSPAQSATLQFDARIDGAATLQLGQSELVTGQFRASAQTGADGLLALTLPPVPLDLAALSSDQSQSRVLRALDVGQDPSLAIELASPVTVPFQVSAADRKVVEGAQLVATPLDVQAGLTSVVESTTVATGGASLSLVLGGRYELVVRDRSGGEAAPVTRQLDIDSTGPGTESIALPSTLELRGELQGGGAGALAGTRVSLHCEGCNQSGSTRAIAIGVAGADGSFTLRVPDPGTVEPTP